jgi:anaerobic dimethyl sulfoxide reductase subunit B (iron-sulfur subunit)
MQYGFYIDTDRCIGCNSCIVACLDENDIQPGQGVKWRRVLNIESGTAPDTRLANVSLSCMHCGKPACEAVCPTGAINKRPEDGIVAVDQDKCIGCRYCFLACPFGVPQYSGDGTMQKCQGCVGLLEPGEEPACAAACTGGALHYGTMEELAKMAAEKSARKLDGATHPSVLISP